MKTNIYKKQPALILPALLLVFAIIIIYDRYFEIKSIFTGSLPQPLDWISYFKIDYIVFIFLGLLLIYLSNILYLRLKKAKV